MTYDHKQMNTFALVNDPRQRALLRGLVIACVSLFALYVYFVGVIIFKTIDRKVVETRTREVRATVAEAETDYLGLVAALDMNAAEAHGLSLAKEVLFSKGTSDTALSLNTARNAF